MNLLIQLQENVFAYNKKVVPGAVVPIHLELHTDLETKKCKYTI